MSHILQINGNLSLINIPSTENINWKLWQNGKNTERSFVTKKKSLIFYHLSSTVRVHKPNSNATVACIVIGLQSSMAIAHMHTIEGLCLYGVLFPSISIQPRVSSHLNYTVEANNSWSQNPCKIFCYQTHISFGFLNILFDEKETLIENQYFVRSEETFFRHYRYCITRIELETPTRNAFIAIQKQQFAL